MIFDAVRKYKLSRIWTVSSTILLVLVIVGGSFITLYLGDKAKLEILEYNKSILSLHHHHLEAEFEKIEEAVKTMSESPLIIHTLTSGKEENIAKTNWVLDRFNINFDIAVSYIMDISGKTIASSNRNSADNFVGKSYHFRPYFKKAVKGIPARYIALGATSLKRGFYASHPVRDGKGKIVGVAVIKKDMDSDETLLADHPNSFMIDPNGVIFLSGRNDMSFKNLWPLTNETRLALLESKQFGEREFEPVLGSEIRDGAEIIFEGERHLVSRKTFRPEGWSIVIMTKAERILIYQLAGIILTVFLCILIIAPLKIHHRTLKSTEIVRESETFLRNIIDSSKDCIFVKDLRLRTILCNKTFAAALGKTPEDLIGKTDIENGWNPEYIKGNKEKGISGIENDDLAVLRGETVHIPSEPGNINGETRYFNTIKIPLRNQKGDISGVIGISRDITNLKLINDALRESEEIYSLTFKTSLDAVNINRLEDGLYIDINEGFTQMTGFTRKEVIGRTSMDINIWNEASDRQKLVRNLSEKGYCENFESIFKKKDGTLINGLMSARVISLKGIPHIISISRDITELKKLEARKAELDDRNRQLQKTESLGRMAGAIAHNFNNQLGVVIGNLELAMNYLSGATEPVGIIKEAFRAACKAADTSGLMLTYLGHTEGKHEPLDLSLACRQKLHTIRALIPKEFELKTDLPSHGPVIKTNETQIMQALTNLVNNAWEAMADRRGVINLTVKTVAPAAIPASYRVPVDWQAQEIDYACIEVVDKGCGITGNDFEKLFDPFFSSKFTGRGLGLPVVLGIARAHSGVVTVESNPGEGSIFRLFFPVFPEEVRKQADMPVSAVTAKTAKTAELSNAKNSGTVLVVEDEESMRKMAGIMLTYMGYTVITAKDGVNAVDVLRKHNGEIQCVLCDLTMPGMDGWETMAALRKISPSVPVVLTSGYDLEIMMKGSDHESPNTFLSKPFQLKELGDAICRAMDHGAVTGDRLARPDIRFPATGK